MAGSGEKTKFDVATPVLLVSDIASTMRWYATHLGFEVQGVPESPPHTFGFLNKGDVQIFLQQLDGYRKPDLYGQREGGVWSVYLRMQGVRELFDVVVASGEPGGPSRLKPHPGGMLKAADALGVAPRDCLVIGDREDADGVAAQAAGMAFRLVG